MSELARVKAALHDVLCADTTTGKPRTELAPYVKKVWKGEPRAGDAVGPVAITIRTTGMDATDVGLTLAVYAMPEPDVIEAQENLDVVIDVLEAILDEATAFTRGEWNIAYDGNLDVFVAGCQMSAGREDF